MKPPQVYICPGCGYAAEVSLAIAVICLRCGSRMTQQPATMRKVVKA